MASSFLLARRVGASASSIPATASQCLFRRYMGAGRLLSCSSSTGRRGIAVLRSLEIRRETQSEGRLFSTTSTTPARGRTRSPLENLANSMEGKYTPGISFANGPEKAATILPSNIETFTTATAGVGSGSGSGAGGIKFTFTPEAEDGAKSDTKQEKKSWFSETDSPTVGYWLLGSAGLVFGIVVLGGLTRLTESGLSITEWKPVTGSIPPLNQADWEEVFEKYKDSPEYRILNPNMTLDEFKFIYYMEWTHRLWGRVIGLSFVIPAAYFIARGRVTGRTAAKLVGISGLIGFQGFIGWWMVKSGLKDDLFTTPGNSVPRVSQYRLTAHLCAAFTVYLAMLYNGLGILRTHKFISNPALAQTEFKVLSDPRLRPLRRTVLGLTLLTFTTAMSGGLVAGLDAGLIYNDFPKMGTGYKPPNSELFNPFYARDKENHKDLWWRNMLENPSTVQFQHRCLAMTTFTSIVGFWLWARYGRVNGTKVSELLTRKMKMGVNGVLHLALLQVTLGISTLIYMVPTSIAAAHQAGSLALLTGLCVLGVRVSPVPQRVVGVVAGRMKEIAGMGPGAAAGVLGLRGVGMGSTGNVVASEAMKAAKEEGPNILRISKRSMKTR